MRRILYISASTFQVTLRTGCCFEIQIRSVSALEVTVVVDYERCIIMERKKSGCEMRTVRFSFLRPWMGELGLTW